MCASRNFCSSTQQFSANLTNARLSADPSRRMTLDFTKGKAANGSPLYPNTNQKSMDDLGDVSHDAWMVQVWLEDPEGSSLRPGSTCHHDPRLTKAADDVGHTSQP